jgi:hypothetical protein
MTGTDHPPTRDTSGEGVYWSAKVYDEQTGECFKLRADADELRVFPVDADFSLSTFARFYEFVVENIDPHAKPVPAPDGGDGGEVNV